MAEITSINRGNHPAGQGRWLRAVALQTATQLVTGMARPSDEGATFNDRDDVLGYAEDFHTWLLGQDVE
jgi:hypothetical protein